MVLQIEGSAKDWRRHIWRGFLRTRAVGSRLVGAGGLPVAPAAKRCEDQEGSRKEEAKVLVGRVAEFECL